MNRYSLKRYRSTDSMSELICENYPMLLVMSRFGIDLGFGEQSIKETCEQSGIDTYTFLSVVNTLVSETKVEVDYKKLSLNSLLDYLHNSHSYFLEYRLPTIRGELTEALGAEGDVVQVILSYYDQYVTEVYQHMMYEEQTLFPYIREVIKETADQEYSIEIYCKHHDKVEVKLSELKNIMIRYYTATTTNELNNVLYDIFSCERDLASHNAIEDFLLVPAIREIEREKTK